MALDYENRGLRALDVLIIEIDRASKDDIRKAIKTCVEMQIDWQPTSARLVWKDMATLLRKQLR